MSDKQLNYDNTITITTDSESIDLRVKEIDLDLFKAVRPMLKADNTEAALVMLKNTVIDEDKEIYQKLLDGRKLKVFLALENAFAEMIGGYSVEVKKKIEASKIEYVQDNGKIVLDDITNEDGNALEQMMALVHFYFKEEPTDTDRLAVLWNRLKFALTFKGELSTKEINYK